MPITNNDLSFMLNSFPHEYKDEITQIAGNLTYINNNFSGITQKIRLSTETIELPSRIHYSPLSQEQINCLSHIQKRIVFCYFLSHHNGYIRQESLKNLFATGTLLEHEVPYVVSLIGSYVIEIINDIFENWDLLIESDLERFICWNPKWIMTIEGRISSYWGVYYQSISKKEYNGFKILKYLNQARKRGQY